jgi:hypothetical protein
MTWRTRQGPAALSVFLWMVGGSSCIGVADPTPDNLPLAAPMREGFTEVADAMQPSCGTLDCHGQAGRNLRLFGGRGLRLAATDTSAEGPTTPPEYEATYWAIVALEPETITAVVRDGGNRPERLLLIRKGRGTTRHKGGTLMHPSDNLDQCIVEWLRGNIAEDPCRVAAKLSADSSL